MKFNNYNGDPRGNSMREPLEAFKMSDTMTAKHKIARELARLRWRMNKLEEMRNNRDRKNHMIGTRDESRQSPYLQFFLGLQLPQAAKSGDGTAKR